MCNGVNAFIAGVTGGGLSEGVNNVRLRKFRPAERKRREDRGGRRDEVGRIYQAQLHLHQIQGDGIHVGRACEVTFCSFTKLQLRLGISLKFSIHVFFEF